MSLPAARADCHLVGLAGVGMSALAQALLDLGRGVSGSDRFLDQGRELDVLRTLRRQGVRLFPQDGSGVAAGARAVVVSTAVEEGNPDLAAARAARVPVLHRAELLARLARGRRLLAVAGTAGKTTTTGMLGWTLERLGLDPTVVNGGEVVGWDRGGRLGSARGGRSAWWAVEADESDRSFLRFRPAAAIVTNISRDHFGMDETVAAFRAFARRVAGPLVAPRAAAGALGLRRRVVVAEEARDVVLLPGGAGSRFAWGGRRFALRMPGAHNVENARLVAALCRELGLDTGGVADALAAFRGIRRRTEFAGAARGVRVFDDYAHNPAKLRAAWEALAPPRGRLWAAWRPHGFGPLRQMFDDLVEAFAAACRPGDRLFLLPVYYAGGTARADVTSGDLAAALRARGVAARAVAGYGALERAARRGLRRGDVFATLGARDPDLPLFARRLVRALGRGRGKGLR